MITEEEKIQVYDSTDHDTICDTCGRMRGNHRANVLTCPKHTLGTSPNNPTYGWRTSTFYDSYLPKLYYSRITEALSKIEIHLYSERARQRYGKQLQFNP